MPRSEYAAQRAAPDNADAGTGAGSAWASARAARLGAASGWGADHRTGQSALLDLGGNLLAQEAELEHGRGDALDAPLVPRMARPSANEPAAEAARYIASETGRIPRGT